MRARCLVVLLAMLAVAGTARAATITVTSLADNTTLDGQVTLREAILAANTDTSVDGSTAGSGADEIVFATGPGTIVLNGTQLPTVVQALTITGLGASRLALDGAQASRVLQVATGVTVALSGLTIRNGRVLGADGGGILNLGSLSVADCILSGNAVDRNGGAIFNQVGLSITRSLFSGNSAQNGGGLDSRGTLAISDTTFAGNFTGGIASFAGGGGGLAYAGTLGTIDNSTFQGNSAGGGGGVLIAGVLRVTNSTFHDNRALNFGGGLALATGIPGTTDIQSCTFTANRADTNEDGVGTGGGISVGSASPPLIHGSIVAENLRGAAILQDIAGSVQPASAANVIGVNTGLIGIVHGANGNQIGTAASPLDPLLGPLQNNGGPTLTRAVLPGSPALDRGSGGICPAMDQRGVPRPLDGDLDTVAVCDVGAYEAFAVSSTMLSFYTLTPCRVVDTRGPAGPTGGPALSANATRFFPVAGLCGVPADAKAVALNATVVNQTDLGDLRLYPAGAAAPNASTINFVTGKTRANNAVLPLGAAGRIAVQCDMPAGSAGTTNLVIDVFGYLR